MQICLNFIVIYKNKWILKFEWFLNNKYFIEEIFYRFEYNILLTVYLIKYKNKVSGCFSYL